MGDCARLKRDRETRLDALDSALKILIILVVFGGGAFSGMPK